MKSESECLRLELTTDQVRGLADWLGQAANRRIVIRSTTLVSGGRSNLTYRVVTDAGDFVLRRPPHGTLESTAHDVTREGSIISKLGGTEVPVPAMVGLCSDVSVLGAPFYLSEFVDGLVVRSAEDAESIPVEQRRAISQNLISILFGIHSIDLEATQLISLARPGNYVERQLRRWHTQHQHVTRPSGALSRLHDSLATAVPDNAQSTLVHGDYRLDNLILSSENFAVAAVLDWELATIGDPLTDVAALYVSWSGPGAQILNARGGPTTAAGFGSRDDVVQSYLDLSAAHLTDFDFYVAFAYWRLGCIVEGVYDRYERGMTAGDQSSVADYPDYVETFANLGRQTLARGTA